MSPIFFDSRHVGRLATLYYIESVLLGRLSLPLSLSLSLFLLEILQPESKGRRRGRGQKGRLVLWLVQLELRGPWRKEGGPVSCSDHFPLESNHCRLSFF